MQILLLPYLDYHVIMKMMTKGCKTPISAVVFFRSHLVAIAMAFCLFSFLGWAIAYSQYQTPKPTTFHAMNYIHLIKKKLKYK